MALIRELKQNLFRDLVAYGVEKPPQAELRQWIERFRAPLKLKESVVPKRQANHFSIGCRADVQLWYGGSIYKPSALHLGRCGFIQDARDVFRFQIPKQNSCLHLVAGLAKSMQYLAELMKEIPVEWVAGCGHGGVNASGAVYFGRLGDNRVREISALDAVYAALLRTRVFDATKNAARMQGDKYYRRRGLPGDVIRHSFGYEYQSFPSFIESPFQALLTLTLAKLAVLDSQEVSNWHYVEGNAEAKILNLLARYKGLDDDARVTYWILAKHGFPRAGGNILRNWGVSAEASISLKSCPPMELPIEDMWLDRVIQLCLGKPVETALLKPFWRQTELPGKSYQTHGNRGIEKLLWGLKSQNVVVDVSENGALKILGFRVSSETRSRIERTLGCAVQIRTAEHKQIYIPESLTRNANQRELVRQILCAAPFNFYPATGRELPVAVVRKGSSERKILYRSKERRG